MFQLLYSVLGRWLAMPATFGVRTGMHGCVAAGSASARNGDGPGRDPRVSGRSATSGRGLTTTRGQRELIRRSVCWGPDRPNMSNILSKP